ncbi:hypothetical protein Tco_0429621 [Tanacetum coccineum]
MGVFGSTCKWNDIVVDMAKRNNRNLVKSIIRRVRLLSLKFKRTIDVLKAQERWEVKLCIVDTLKGVFGRASSKSN